MPEATRQLAEAEISGLNVRSRDGDKLGHVKSLLVDKESGQAVYAVLSLGGFLGLNKSYYPVPFHVLVYGLPEDDYVLTLDRRLLEGGPSWSSNPPDFDQAYADRVTSYYRSAPQV
ncbi:PRC-barrel domain-containing protein [Novosphingobium sp. JCM 18896]|uniref:PRC-barrel domain-containing protein n=1 Tax=Novosphingobium sp. JCM 18896 TaxID=2989731 RepID=UPI002223C3F3|nr:PRC-barrel domain-containing protein [Novosphingobium sp. JCM 18896]MCW1432195.1 PRC-barrel domain-containing protein [Novosphingobium sp. JCM 18896]